MKTKKSVVETTDGDNVLYIAPCLRKHGSIKGKTATIPSSFPIIDGLGPFFDFS